MLWTGLAVTLLGFALSVASLGITSSVGGRMALVCFGLCVSLFGIIGLINRVYVEKAIWRK